MDDSLAERLRLYRALVFVNPFSEERSRLECAVLATFGEEAGTDPAERLERVILRARETEDSLRSVRSPSRLPADVRDAVGVFALFGLFHRMLPELDQLVETGGGKPSLNRKVLERLETGLDECFPWIRLTGEAAWMHSDHLLSCFFQLRRAFHYIHRFIVGDATPVRRLRERVWESVFTRDMRRYQLWMHEAVGRFPTLVLGPSGSGKELVSRAIGQSRFLPCDKATAAFGSGEGGAMLLAVNLGALSPTLIESEIFGHVRGAFTGAQADRKGLFETAGDGGCVFLDEIGEVSGEIQVKLLRLLQSGEFQRLGESTTRCFRGKVIAATHRDLPAEARRGNFREDLFYRLCGDQVTTPALRDILADRPTDLGRFVSFVCGNLFGKDAARSIAADTAGVLTECLPPDYPWPGNFRELEQAVRSIVVTGRYEPLAEPSLPDEPGPVEVYRAASATMDEWTALYARRALAVHGSRRRAARALGVDPRTLARHSTGPQGEFKDLAGAARQPRGKTVDPPAARSNCGPS